MTPAPWPLRLIPRRSPGFLASLGISVAALGAAVAVRLLVLGFDRGLGLSVTYFPALIVVTLASGARWGWLALAAAVGLHLISPSAFAVSGDAAMLLGLFVLSGGVTVLVAAGFRESLVQLDEASRAQAAAQRAVAATEDRFRALADSAPILMWVTRTDGRREFANRAYVEFLGVGYQAAIDFDWRNVLHPDDMARVLREQAEGEASRALFTLEARYLRHDGQYRWVRSVSQPRWSADGAFAGFVGVGYDVTEQRRAEDLLRESEKRFRTLADSAPILMWISGVDNRREFVNQTYLDFLGVDFATATSGRLFERVHPDDAKSLRREAARQGAQGGPISVEARFRRTDGEWRWLRTISKPRLGSDGEILGYIGVAYDTTEAHQVQGDLTRINDLLAERVQAALAERDEAEAALQRAQKLEAVGRLTGGVAHDFNNLLTVVIGALDLMQRRPDDAVRRGRMIEAALGAARRGERLTQQLLAFSRRQALKPEPVVVDTLLLEGEPLLRRAVGEVASLCLDLQASDAVAHVDPSQFEAAIMNLVVNARDATPPGGAIRIETSSVKLAAQEVESLTPGEYVSIAVRDTGAGMDEATIARAFEPFFTTKSAGHGTGLGLSQVYGFAHQSGGAVTLRSTVGEGTCVCLYLPREAADAAAHAAPAAAPVEVEHSPPLRVLLVEDDAQVAEMAQAMLRELGHEVRLCTHADSAVELVHAGEPFDLMLTDLIMPGALSGLDLAREVVARRPGLPVILTSGYTGEVLSAAEASEWPLLRKPYGQEQLARIIAQVSRAARRPN
jgi:PAS domain S-box-containing protein